MGKRDTEQELSGLFGGGGEGGGSRKRNRSGLSRQPGDLPLRVPAGVARPPAARPPRAAARPRPCLVFGPWRAPPSPPPPRGPPPAGPCPTGGSAPRRRGRSVRAPREGPPPPPPPPRGKDEPERAGRGGEAWHTP